MLARIKEVFEQEETDFWDELGQEDQIAINEGLTLLDNREHESHQEVKEAIKTCFNFLALPIRHSLRTRHEEMELLEYLVKQFSSSTAKRVYQKIEEVLELIALYPESYPVSRKQKGYENVYSANKQVSTIGSIKTILKSSALGSIGKILILLRFGHNRTMYWHNVSLKFITLTSK